MTGRLRDRAVTALDLALALHPTPAVGGRPLDQALELIASLEPAPRGRYAGPVGWVDATGDGEFAVALRCAEVDGDRAVLSVGNGIVAGSDPIDEWTETVAKLATMREALG
jgi:isochorismate synthase EntC